MRISDWSSDVCSSDLIAEPLRPLARAVDAITMPWRSPIRELRRNLEARFDLFRRYSINQSSHLLRYEKERTALAAVEAGVGNRDRDGTAERCGGKECVRKWRSGGAPGHYNKKTTTWAYR